MMVRKMAQQANNKKRTDLTGPDRLRDPTVQKAILDRVLKRHPTLTVPEALEHLKEAGL
jgi:hypothetical protein